MTREATPHVAVRVGLALKRRPVEAGAFSDAELLGLHLGELGLLRDELPRAQLVSQARTYDARGSTVSELLGVARCSVTL